MPPAGATRSGPWIRPRQQRGIVVTGCASLVTPTYSPDYPSIDRLKTGQLGKVAAGTFQPRDPQAPVNKMRVESRLSSKKAAHVMTDTARNLEVISPGGGGDKISYKPYRDVRDALRAVCSDVVAVNSASAQEAFRTHGVSHVLAQSANAG